MEKVGSLRAPLRARIVVFALCFCCLFFCSSGVYAMNQAQITAAMGAGWNLGNQLEANTNGTPYENAWGNPIITQTLITTVKNLGFKTIRIPVSLLSRIGAAPDYTIEAAWLARIKEVVDYAINQGMYVLLDGVHGDGYYTISGGWLLVASSDQATIRAKYQKVWQQYANYFAAYDEHLIFESMNEVFNDTYYDPDPALYQNLNAYNQIFIDTIRQTGGNNATRWLLIPGWNTVIDLTADDYGFVMPTDNYRSSSIPSNEKRIMISAHFYQPWDFCGDSGSGITQWGTIAADPSKRSNWGQEDWQDSQFGKMYNAFVLKGYPVVIGEMAATDKTTQDSTNNTYRIYWVRTVCTNGKQYGAIPVYWDNGVNDAFGCAILNRNTLAVTQQGILDAIMNGINANVTPPPAATPTPIPSVGPGVKISVLYKCSDTGASASGIRFSFQVRNDDTVAVPLANVKIKYWYVRDDGKWQGFNCYYAVVGSGNVFGNLVRIPLSEAFPTADFYVEAGFAAGAGSLSPGANSGEVQVTLTKYDGSNYNQTNDYSFDSGMTDYGQNPRVSGYVNGLLVFGTEPTGATPGSTSIPTATPTTAPTPVPGIKGDVNGSGTVDIVDALLIAQYYVGLNPASFNPAVADVNCSSSIDIVDALLVAQYYVGLVSTFPC